ncbi:Pyrroline-5-carboxylate reductase [Pseudomonas coronafaciens pv. garcae]|uniref:Pyrroline-5-carboxylate reductase n=2 Tax=Pseudomonas syringae group TaxID=136849 RepID=A0AB37QP37_9PSED|nr:Pyrroline-5-carboxylate reductase [Pseudomonas coronafaciens pv. garcae]RMS00503.1 Pyrroline-5-carboxylate reductase [Pseudomonas coronafaciens pv. garcae]
MHKAPPGYGSALPFLALATMGSHNFAHKDPFMSKIRIAFIGAGNMAASLIGGLRAQGVDAALICASAPGAETRERIAKDHGIKVFADNADAINGADVVVLAVKPQMMKSVCQALKSNLEPHQLIVSVAAGITCASLTQWLGEQPVVRCMPNTPSLLRQGASGLYATDKVTAEQRDQAEQLLSAVGLAVWVEQEKHMNAVTAVSGSGPAYFFLMMEAMTAAGVKLGLPKDVAEKLTLQTALGSALIATGSDVDAGELRRRVASPGGTTEAAIKAFQAGGFEALVKTALTAADHRAAELAEQLGK